MSAAKRIPLRTLDDLRKAWAWTEAHPARQNGDLPRNPARRSKPRQGRVGSHGLSFESGKRRANHGGAGQGSSK